MQPAQPAGHPHTTTLLGTGGVLPTNLLRIYEERSVRGDLILLIRSTSLLKYKAAPHRNVLTKPPRNSSRSQRRSNTSHSIRFMSLLKYKAAPRKMC